MGKSKNNTVQTRRSVTRQKSADQACSKDRDNRMERLEEVRTQKPIDIEEICIAIVISIVTLVIYVQTAHPSLPGGDSGELIVAAYEMGVAHPPGYPLFTMLAKIFITVLPFGSVAWRVNFFSALCGALSTALIFLTVFRLTSNLGVSILSSGMFAFSRLTWTWSVCAEVFALNNLLISALLFTAATFYLCEKKYLTKVCLLGSFLCGLCLTNQHTSVLFVVVIIPWVFYSLWKDNHLTMTLFLQCGCSFTAGLLPYLYLPISAVVNIARWTWGDQSSLWGFLIHLMRREYGTLDLLKDHTGQGFFYGLKAYIDHAWVELTFVICGFFFVSFVTTFIKWRQCRSVSMIIVYYIMLFIYLGFFCWRANLDIDKPLFFRVVERFWIQSDLLVCILAAVAADDVLSYVSEYFKLELNWYGVASAVLAVTFQIMHWWSVCDQSHNYVVHDFALQTLGSFPKDSIVLTKGDLPSNSLRYFHLCENKRPDISVFDQEVLTYDWSLRMTRKFYPSINFPGDRWQPYSGLTKEGFKAFTFRDLIDANYKQHPIFACIGVQEHESSWETSYTLQPFGVCWRLVSRREVLNLDKLVAATQGLGQNWKHNLLDKDDGSWENVASAEMWRARTATALFFLELGLQHPTDSKEASTLFLKSYNLYESAMSRYPSAPSYWHRNFAIVCEHLSRQNPARQRHFLTLTIRHFKMAATLDPDNPDSEKMIETVQALQTFLDSSTESHH